MSPKLFCALNVLLQETGWETGNWDPVLGSSTDPRAGLPSVQLLVRQRCSLLSPPQSFGGGPLLLPRLSFVNVTLGNAEHTKLCVSNPANWLCLREQIGNH